MRRRRFVGLIGASAALLAASGAVSCAGGRDAADKELSQIRGELAKLRADQARAAERLDNLELAKGTFHGGSAAPVSSFCYV